MQTTDLESIVKLSSPQYEGKASLEEVLFKRRSRRQFIHETILKTELSQLLWAAYGKSGTITKPGNTHFNLLTTPSAGASYPLKVYTIAGNVECIEKGCYQYLPDDHSLKLMQTGDLRENLCQAAHNQTFIKDASATIIITAQYEKITKHYGERGAERYVCIEAGHASQNVYLQAEALEIGTCIVSAFDDDKIGELLHLVPEETPLVIMPLGRYPVHV